ELVDGLAGDLFCLLDSHDCPPVSGSSCSLHPSHREQRHETGGRSREMPTSRSEREAGLSDAAFFAARGVLVETVGVRIYTPGRRQLGAVKQESKPECK